MYGTLALISVHNSNKTIWLNSQAGQIFLAKIKKFLLSTKEYICCRVALEYKAQQRKQNRQQYKGRQASVQSTLLNVTQAMTSSDTTIPLVHFQAAILNKVTKNLGGVHTCLPHLRRGNGSPARHAHAHLRLHVYGIHVQSGQACHTCNSCPSSWWAGCQWAQNEVLNTSVDNTQKQISFNLIFVIRVCWHYLFLNRKLDRIHKHNLVTLAVLCANDFYTVIKTYLAYFFLKKASFSSHFSVFGGKHHTPIWHFNIIFASFHWCNSKWFKDLMALHTQCDCSYFSSISHFTAGFILFTIYLVLTLSLKLFKSYALCSMLHT